MNQKNLIIAFGGVSPEHEVSVLTAMQVFSALENSSYNLVPLYITKSGHWLGGDALSNLENYKDLNTLESMCYPVSFTKSEMGITHLTEQGNFGLFKNRFQFRFTLLFVLSTAVKAKMVHFRESASNTIFLIREVEC